MSYCAGQATGYGQQATGYGQQNYSGDPATGNWQGIHVPPVPLPKTPAPPSMNANADNLANEIDRLQTRASGLEFNLFHTGPHAMPPAKDEKDRIAPESLAEKINWALNNIARISEQIESLNSRLGG